MEQIVSTGIIDSFFKKLKESLSVDVAIVGGGPSGLVAAYYLAKNGIKVSLYERTLAFMASQGTMEDIPHNRAF